MGGHQSQRQSHSQSKFTFPSCEEFARYNESEHNSHMVIKQQQYAALTTLIKSLCPGNDSKSILFDNPVDEELIQNIKGHGYHSAYDITKEQYRVCVALPYSVIAYRTNR